jgi:hypothetical protein
MTQPRAALQPGDNIVYLLDRTHVTAEDLAAMGHDELVRMADEWLKEHPDRFFVTVARNYQPVSGTKLNTFDSHDDSVLFPDKAALLSALPMLARASGGYLWVILATRDVENAVQAAITAFKPN